MHVRALQHPGDDGVEERLGELGLAVVDEQADVIELRPAPGRVVERSRVELVAQPLDALPHAVVVEADALLHRLLRLRPGGNLEALLRIGARLPEEAVVAVESLDQDVGDPLGDLLRACLRSTGHHGWSVEAARASRCGVAFREQQPRSKRARSTDMATESLITPPEDGARIVAGQPIPDNPIIPFIEGDGIGVDITPVMQAVVDAAVATAYDGSRSIHWMEVYAGEKSTRLYGADVWLPAETLDALREYSVSIKGPMTTPVGGGIRSLNVALRQELDLYVCLRPVRYFRGVPSPLKDPSADRHGDLPREHRGHLRRHRVGGRVGGRPQGDRLPAGRDGRTQDPLPGDLRASGSSRSRAKAPSGSCGRR